MRQMYDDEELWRRHYELRASMWRICCSYSRGRCASMGDPRWPMDGLTGIWMRSVGSSCVFIFFIFLDSFTTAGIFPTAVVCVFTVLFLHWRAPLPAMEKPKRPCVTLKWLRGLFHSVLKVQDVSLVVVENRFAMRKFTHDNM